MTRRIWLLAALMSSLAAPAWGQPRGSVRGPAVAEVSILDVGQGDAILIRSPEGKVALVDAGPSKDIVPTLRKRGITALDLVVVSHHHDDHYSGMDDAIKAFEPRVYLASSSGHTTPQYLKLLELVRDRKIQAIGPTATPRRIVLGSVTLTVLPKAPVDTQEENNNSVGIRVQHGAVSVLLTGDSEEPERLFWMQNPEARALCSGATILKAAHHGSRNGTDSAWLDLVHPQLVAASLGAGNGFGHPHPEFLDLLARRGIPLLRTDEVGTITIRSDGVRWAVTIQRPAPQGPPATPPDLATKLVNLNTATQAELEALPGVGPELAKRIRDGRPYRTVEDLDRVSRVGPALMEKLRSLLTMP